MTCDDNQDVATDTSQELTERGAKLAKPLSLSVFDMFITSYIFNNTNAALPLLSDQ